MSDTDWSKAITTIASLGVSVEEGASGLIEAVGNAEYAMLQRFLFTHSSYGYPQCSFLAAQLMKFRDRDIAHRAVALSRLGYAPEEALHQIKKEFPLPISDNSETDTMLDGTPIVDAEPMLFQRSGIWYRADGTPIED
jgi:hypothetical protein